MYELTCPYCGKIDLYFEIEGHFNRWIGYNCEHCGKKFFVLHRSFFDLTYDTTDVQVKTQEQIDEMVAAGTLKKTE
jgi:transposase-like protein